MLTMNKIVDILKSFTTVITILIQHIAQDLKMNKEIIVTLGRNIRTAEACL